MYSKEEAARIKREFWTQFGQEYSRKWLLYDTKIKDVAFKFYADTKKAGVYLDIEPKNENTRKIYFEKLFSLRNILLEDFIPELEFDEEIALENGKIISRVGIEKTGVCINNPKTWEEIFNFFYDNMDAFERFFYEYEDYIRDLELNT
ncbi:MAG: DUF4268 domain-containing protein [Flavobacteriales bacterium]|nr:DUF4268 domain-containing protein [Flavobacteriales bacterium]